MCALYAFMFDINAYIKAAEGRIWASGIPLPDFLARAGISRTTWARWKSGAFEPRLSALRKVDDALKALPKKRAA